MTILCMLWLAAFVGTILAGFGKCPLWVPVLLISIAGLINCWPLR